MLEGSVLETASEGYYILKSGTKTNAEMLSKTKGYTESDQCCENANKILKLVV